MTWAASLNLLKVIREDLLLEVRTAVHEAKEKDANARRTNLRVPYDGQTKTFDLEVIPISSNLIKERFFLVLFEEATLSAPPRANRALTRQELTKQRLARGASAGTWKVKSRGAHRNLRRLRPTCARPDLRNWAAANGTFTTSESQVRKSLLMDAQRVDDEARHTHFVFLNIRETTQVLKSGRALVS